MFLKISQTPQENTCARGFSIVAGWSLAACKFINKETSMQLFFWGACEIFKNTFLGEHLQATASGCNSLAWIFFFWRFTVWFDKQLFKRRHWEASSTLASVALLKNESQGISKIFPKIESASLVKVQLFSQPIHQNVSQYFGKLLQEFG